jgi:hypothetical protein
MYVHDPEPELEPEPYSDKTSEPEPEPSSNFPVPQPWSPLWKEAQQEVQQHWFIDSYIAAYIQVLYRATIVHPTGLTVNQGCRQLSTPL